MRTLEMKIYNIILSWKLKKISVLSSGKYDKHEYLMGQKLLSSNRSQIYILSFRNSLGNTNKNNEEKKTSIERHINIFFDKENNFTFSNAKEIFKRTYTKRYEKVVLKNVKPL